MTIQVAAQCQNAACGRQFTFPRAVGKARRHCTDACRDANRLSRRVARKAAPRSCSVGGCIKPCTRVGAQLCEMHYGRRRRGAPDEAPPPAYRYAHSAGYVVLLRPDHPIADGVGRVYEHRVVAYEHHGGICPPCHWCSSRLTWSDAVVDHLDEEKDHNDPSNLVVACSPCNRARGAMLPFISRLTPAAFEEFVALLRQHRAG